MGLDALITEIGRLVSSNGAAILLFVVFLLSIIQIAPVKLNPWTWISRRFGASVTKAMEEEIGALREEIKGLKEQQRQDFVAVGADLANVNASLAESKKALAAMASKVEERAAVTARYRIVSMNDELLRGVSHTKEALDQSLYDVKTYEAYCERHPEFRNHMIAMSIENIENVYRERLRKRDFLEYSARDGAGGMRFSDYLKDYLSPDADTDADGPGR